MSMAWLLTGIHADLVGFGRPAEAGDAKAQEDKKDLGEPVHHNTLSIRQAGLSGLQSSGNSSIATKPIAS